MTPSKAAMRAAEKWHDTGRKTVALGDITALAEIIDAEYAGLVAAAKDVSADIDAIGDAQGDGDDVEVKYNQFSGWYNTLAAALADSEPQP